MLSKTLLPLLLAATSVSAFGCSSHTFTQCADNIVHWYDPDDGQICDPLDCGGGRAPPKTTVPCCPSYKGTESCVNTPSYLPCFGSIGKSTLVESAKPSSSVVASTTVGNAPAQTTAAVQSSSVKVVGPTSASLGVSSAASVTQPPASGVTEPSQTMQSGRGNSTVVARTSTLPAVQSGNAASGLQLNALAAIAGAVMVLA